MVFLYVQELFFYTTSVCYHPINPLIEDMQKESTSIFLDFHVVNEEKSEEKSEEKLKNPQERQEDVSSESSSVIDIEKKYHIAEMSLFLGGSFAVIGALNFQRARSFEKQMLMESNNYRYNELLQQYNQHRNQYILAVPSSLIFTTLGVSLYARRNIHKSFFFQPVDKNEIQAN